jgi:aminopeptidase N
MANQADKQNPSIYLKDYRAPDFLIESAELVFTLGEEGTLVQSRLQVKRNVHTAEDAPLVLNAEAMQVTAVAIDGQDLANSQWVHSDDHLAITTTAKDFVLACTNLIHPETNTSLNGLYRSRTMFCSQCEPHGFRRITPYLDRPDVLSKFQVKVIANKDKYPVLLSNGNPIDRGDLDNNLHFAEWQDPIFKPAYLFALVAGDLEVIEDSFTTMSGRDVLLRIFVETKDLDKVDHAMLSLKQAMQWDEETYGREYDLDIFMIVAVDDFNMGAMENKGLNIFNTSAVLANPKITTDARFQWIQAVVGHEYFHNWSGNRVTCRDWFQLSLKEGFTVFRDSHFSADLNSEAVKRIEDVRTLRAYQFAEDAGPLAHPVQPPSYQEINNFYTLTVYEKGAEIVRMQANLLGPEKFRQATDLYFDRFDGQAVAIEDFVGCISEISGLNMGQFMNWYKQAGTPVVEAVDTYDAETQEYRLTLSQSCPPTPESDIKEPFVIPVKIGLIGTNGALEFQLDDAGTISELATEKVLNFNQRKQAFIFKGVTEIPTPSLLRGLSAPVKLRYQYSKKQLVHLIRTDTDGFNRWDASQQLAGKAIDESASSEPLIDSLVNSYQEILEQDGLDPAVAAMMVTLPSMEALSDSKENLDVAALYNARTDLREQVAAQLEPLFKAVYINNKSSEGYQPSAQQIGRRSLKNVALAYWVDAASTEAITACEDQYKNADNMTDSAAALSTLVNAKSVQAKPIAKQLLENFYQHWKEEALVVNQWLLIQSTSSEPGGLDRVKALIQHEAFDIKNPNKVRSLIGGFCGLNPGNFHNIDGSGYKFLADKIMQIDSLNPQTASRLITPLTRWKKYDSQRQKLMRAELERIAETDLSSDARELVGKSLV